MFSSFNAPVKQWAGKRIWIIGASSGIGAAMAQQIAQQGAQVAISARRVELLQQVASGHDSMFALPLDVLDQAAWATAYAQIIERMGGVDLLLFCAADYRPERTWEVKPELAARTLQINVGSVYSGVATVLPELLKQGHGGIGIVASVAGYMGLPNASVYGPSKAALINLAEILYTDLHPRGLDVYLINPGFVDTGLTAKNSFYMPALQTTQQAAAAIWSGISAGKFEIHFPRRFTQILKFIQLLPYSVRFFLMTRLVP